MRDYVDQINSIRLCAESDDPVDECCWEDCNQHHGSRDNMCRQKIMMDAADAIEELVACVTDINVGNEWISVEERLPEIGRTVLTSDGVDVWTNWRLRVGNKGVVEIQWAYNVEEVTHWMPLPEPPKEVE